MIADSKERFSNKVRDYIKYRPHYPAELFLFLENEGILRRGFVVADIGSGTGISCAPFLEYGCKVFGIEPNEAMRKAAEEQFKSEGKFISLNAMAEKTEIEDKSVDLIFAGQAFHWFDVPACATEFRRILKPGGSVCLCWNDRKYGIPVLEAYEAMLQKFATDYNEVNHRNVGDSKFDILFGKGNHRFRAFDNFQVFDKEGLRGRLLSSSYIPKPDQPAFIHMMKELDEIFDRYQRDGKLKFEYDTKLHYGTLS